jgi:hypothetical protein
MDRGDGRDPVLVGVLALASAHDPQCSLGLDDRDALAVDRADEDLPVGRLDRLRGASGIESCRSRSRHRGRSARLSASGRSRRVISATSVIASSNGPHTTALMSRRWHS